MKFFKRIVLYIFASISAVCFFGCERTNDLRSASFFDITVPSSQNKTIKVVFEKDSRVDEKFVDIQLRANKASIVLCHEENKEDFELTFEDTKWKSLTTLFYEAQNRSGEEEFKKYKETQSLTYIFSSEEEVVLTFRAVVGEPEQNSLKTGYILTNAKEISDEFKLKLTKK